MTWSCLLCCVNTCYPNISGIEQSCPLVAAMKQQNHLRNTLNFMNQFYATCTMFSKTLGFPALCHESLEFGCEQDERRNLMFLCLSVLQLDSMNRSSSIPERGLKDDGANVMS